LQEVEACHWQDIAIVTAGGSGIGRTITVDGNTESLATVPL